MINVVGVRLKKVGKIYYFNPNSFDLKKGDDVIVETSLGLKLGKVVYDVKKVRDDEIVSPLKPVLKIADEADIQTAKNNEIKAQEAFKICKKLIEVHQLDMKLINAEYTFDNSIVVFYFNSPNRVDFRSLIKDLAKELHIRIEMRQVPVREHAKLMNCIGNCGRQTCCSSWITKFNLINVKMAKNQDLSLNPYKISGVCGKLMCCLKFENENYKHAKNNMPVIGEIVKVDNDIAVVCNVNILEEKVSIRRISDVKDSDIPKLQNLRNIKEIEESDFNLENEIFLYQKTEVQRMFPMGKKGCNCPMANKRLMAYEEVSEEELSKLERE